MYDYAQKNTTKFFYPRSYNHALFIIILVNRVKESTIFLDKSSQMSWDINMWKYLNKH